MNDHSVVRVNTPIKIDHNWHKQAWSNIDEIELKNFVGDLPIHFPNAYVKVAYDREGIYLIWKIEDQFVKSIYAEPHDPVSFDSCVEFFFAPSADQTSGYFNIETNCSGTILFKHRMDPHGTFVCLNKSDLKEIEISQTFSELLTNEIQDKVTWYMEYKIPFAMLQKYADFTLPKKGTIWRANFFKIADETSHPHWITWNNLPISHPDFHTPEFFGQLTFE